MKTVCWRALYAEGVSRMKTVLPISARRAGELCRLLEERGVGNRPFQKLVENPDELVTLMQSKGWLELNPCEVVIPACDYPSDWKVSHWEEQFEQLRTIYPELEADGNELLEMAKRYITSARIWSAKHHHQASKQDIRLFDGLAVFPLPGRAAKRYGIGDLWADVAKDEKGVGLLSRLCQEILFPHLNPTVLFGSFDSFFRALKCDQLLFQQSIAKWYQELETKTQGDFICRPVSFGRCLAGYSAEASLWEIDNILAGCIAGDLWGLGNSLLTNAGRLRSGTLALQALGNLRSYEGDGGRAPAAACFYRNDKLYLDASGIRKADECCGSGFFRR